MLKCYRELFVKLPGDERFHGVLVDTGAEFSCINQSLAQELHVHVHPPDTATPLSLADASTSVPRMGTTRIKFEVMFPHDVSRVSMRMEKQFEVMNMNYDFIFGSDILRHIFPDSELSLYMPPPAPITDAPTVLNPSDCTMDISVTELEHMCLDQPHLLAALSTFKDEVETQLTPSSTRPSTVSSTSDEAPIPATAPHIAADLQRMAHQMSDDGAGFIPEQEQPHSTHTSTPHDVHETIKLKRDTLLSELQPLLEQNYAIQGFCNVPEARVYIKIRAEDETKLFRRQYTIPQSLIPLADLIIDRWKQTARIGDAPVGCIFNSPLLIVPKKDENGKLTGIRVCLDVRTVNLYLQNDDKFILPFIPDLLSQLRENTIFGEFDLSEAYLQIPIDPESRKYTAFTWKGKQYMFNSSPFGLKHLPSHYQRFITYVFRDMPFVYPYIDNITFASKSWSEHRRHAQMIIERLTQCNLRIKPGSANLGNTQIKILGHIVNSQGVGIAPDKLNDILEWKQPANSTELKSFLGICTFLRDHIRHYADLAAPLEKVKNKVPFEWTPLMSKHFELIKRAFSKAPLLSFPDLNQPFSAATDASNTGVGGVLFQPGPDDPTKITPDNIVAICSRQLTESQQRYPAFKKELWAVVYCLRKFHSYIWGRQSTTLITDHKPLIYLLKSSNLSNALQQWLDVLLDYNINVIHQPGIMHVLPDALSRMYESAYASKDTVWGTASNITFNIVQDATAPTASDVIVIESIRTFKEPTSKRRLESGGRNKRKRSVINRIACPDICDAHSDFLLSQQYGALASCAAAQPICTNWLAHGNNDTYSICALDSQSPADVGPEVASELGSSDMTDDIEEPAPSETGSGAASHSDRMEEESTTTMQDTATQTTRLSDEELLLLALEKRGKTAPPFEERIPLVQHTHLQGHFGEQAVYKHLYYQGHWWPRMRQDIRNVIADCNDCMKYVVTKTGFHPFRSVDASLPGDHYQVDLAILPKSTDGWSTLLVLVDVFTGFVVLRPLPNRESETIARELWDIFTLIGSPKILQSDNGGEFVNGILTALTRMSGVEHRLITPYNPRADGKVERTVRTVKETIAKLVRGALQHWPIYVPFVQMAYNTKITELTGSSPFSLMFGRQMNAFANYASVQYQPTNIQDWKAYQEKVLALIYPAIELKARGIKEKYLKKLSDIKKRIFKEELPAGTQVMIKDPIYIKSLQRKPTTEPAYIGPYTIIRRTTHGAYVVQDETGATLDRRIPLDQMKVIRGPFTHAPRDVPDDVYVVEHIEKHRGTPGSYEYYVKWKGWPRSYNTWEDASRFRDTEVIKKYWRQARASVLKTANM